jgi:hypothetical protein
MVMVVKEMLRNSRELIGVNLKLVGCGGRLDHEIAKETKARNAKAAKFAIGSTANWARMTRMPRVSAFRAFATLHE